MDVNKRAKINRIAGFVCLGLALLNATFAVLAMVADKNVHSGTGGIAIAASLFAIGIVCLTRGRRHARTAADLAQKGRAGNSEPGEAGKDA